MIEKYGSDYKLWWASKLPGIRSGYEINSVQENGDHILKIKLLYCFKGLF